MLFEVIIALLTVMALILTEYANRVGLSDSANAAIQTFTKVMLGLRGVDLTPKDGRIYIHDKKTGRFMAKDKAQAILSITLRILQATILTLGGGSATLL